MVKSALIIGVTGQDGSYLAFKLLKKGYKIFGTIRSKVMDSESGLCKLKIKDDIEFFELDPSNFKELFEIVKSPEILEKMKKNISKVSLTDKKNMIVTKILSNE